MFHAIYLPSFHHIVYNSFYVVWCAVNQSVSQSVIMLIYYLKLNSILSWHSMAWSQPSICLASKQFNTSFFKFEPTLFIFSYGL